MSFLYAVRTRNNFNPADTAPFRVSRSKIDLFLECSRCFYLDQRLGIKRPDTFPLTLNIAVDELLKKEFDLFRESKTRHPIMEKYDLDVLPLQHKDLEVWRDAMRKGIEFHHTPTNLSARGGVDDVWVRPDGEFVIVDYKAKATREEITLDGDLGAQYKRQMEVYQWLFRKNGFPVSSTGYFLYVNADKDADKLDDKLEFEMSLLPCEGKVEWIEPTLFKIKDCLVSETLPDPSETCQYCAYRKHAAHAGATYGKAKIKPKQNTTTSNEALF